jgi:dynein heavy chain
MYGGHITDGWDRILCSTLMAQYMRSEILDGLNLAPEFQVPGPLSYKQYLEYIEQNAPAESPTLYGLHPNAEIMYRTQQGDELCQTILELQPRKADSAGAATDDDVVRGHLEEILSNLPEDHNMLEVNERLEDDRTPYQNVFYQECERMNILLEVVRQAMSDLDLGLKGELAISDAMQGVYNALFLNQVPEAWEAYSFMSKRPLSSWFNNLLERNQQLADWSGGDLQPPRVVNVSLFFNPMAYLTAVMQSIALANAYDLDLMMLTTEVLKKTRPDQIEAAAREGAYVFGMSLEGARWDVSGGFIDDSKMKELFCPMPVMLMKSLPSSKVDLRDVYPCPVYKTQDRGVGFVCTCYIKTKQPPKKWVMAGVSLILDVVE